MLNSYIFKHPKFIKYKLSNLFEYLGVFLLILFIPVTAILVMVIALVAGIITKGAVR